MTRCYTESHYNGNTKQWETAASWSFTIYPHDDTIFTVCRNGVVKSMNVIDSTYIYHLNANIIYAKKGAFGLFGFVDNALYERFQECLAWRILHWIFEYGE